MERNFLPAEEGGTLKVRVMARRRARRCGGRGGFRRRRGRRNRGRREQSGPRIARRSGRRHLPHGHADRAQVVPGRFFKKPIDSPLLLLVLLLLLILIPPLVNN